MQTHHRTAHRHVETEEVVAQTLLRCTCGISYEYIVYMPPEAMGEHTQYNRSLDIFSFGNIALFTLTQEFIGPKLKAATYTDPTSRKIIGCSEIEWREHSFDALYVILDKSILLHC